MRLTWPFAALLLVAAAAPAAALDTFGPPFGANRYTTSLTTVDGVEDVDDYVADLLAGEALDVTVAANKGSTALLGLSLVDPDGQLTALAAPAVKEKAGGKSVTLKRFAITKSGRWGVRVSGKGGAQGAYTVSFKVTPGKPVTVASLHLGGTDPLTTDFAFDGLDGALLDLTVKWSKKESAVHFGSVKDPDGNVVTATAAESPKGTTTLKRVPLHTGNGRYTVRLFIDAGAAPYSITYHVTPQGRPTGKKPIALPIAEPVLDPLAAPMRGAAGRLVHFTGTGFIADPAPNVFFGKLPGINPQVTDGGKAIDVVAPAGASGATVSVAVVSQDGQASVRDAYFFFVPLPTITNLVNASNVAVRGGIGTGGTALTLVGTGFEDGQTITFGNRPATGVVRASATRYDLLTPPAPNGAVNISLRDSFGRLVTAGFQFEFKLPPKFSNPAFDPHYGPAGGGATVTIKGTGFEPADELRVDGTLVQSTFVDPSKRTFVLGNLSIGFHGVTLTDRFGLVGSAPDFELRNPPTIGTVQAMSGARLNLTDVAVGGGANVRITGTNFDTDHTVTVAGFVGSATSVSSTQIDFVSPPAVPFGPLTVTVTDHAGQAASATNALRGVGYADETVNRHTAMSSTDDYSALRGAVDDLDGDGVKDDLVLVSDTSSPGSRLEFTRLMLGNGTSLVDRTASNLPTKGADPQGVDSFKAQAVAIGDLDGGGNDIVIAGDPTGASRTYIYNYYEARVFRNSGGGSFSFSNGSPPVRYSSVYCSDGAGGSYQVVKPGVYAFINYSYTDPINGSKATALAIGDLDNDGRSDIVMATDNYRFARVYIAPSNVTFTPGNYFDAQASSQYTGAYTLYYAPALRLFRNRGNSFEDVTFPRLPLCGTSQSAAVPGFHARDMKIGDIDGDASHSPDIVVTWDDPLGVSPLGLSSGTDSAQVATRILINNGSGFFTDQTSTWLPAGSSPEFWQANRVELTDLDGDGKLDLLLLHAQLTDAYLGAPSFGSRALRILHNGGPGVGFVDVTSTVLPSVPLAGTKDDNLRGTALKVGDVNGDGRPDILVGTTESLLGTSGSVAVRRTRLLRATSFGTYVDSSAFLPLIATHTGEADDLLLGDVAGNSDPSLLLLSEKPPAATVNGEALRVFDWRR